MASSGERPSRVPVSRAVGSCRNSPPAGATPATAIGCAPVASAPRRCGRGATDDGARLPHLWPRRPGLALAQPRALSDVPHVLAPAWRGTPAGAPAPAPAIPRTLSDLRAAGARTPARPVQRLLPLLVSARPRTPARVVA